MPKYEVTIWENIFHTVYVYADDARQAENLARFRVTSGTEDYSTDSAGIIEIEVEETSWDGQD